MEHARATAPPSSLVVTFTRRDCSGCSALGRGFDVRKELEDLGYRYGARDEFNSSGVYALFFERE
jgi:hypothetical protein